MTKAYQRKLRLAETHLRAVCPTLATWIETHGKCELKPDWERETYEALVRAVAHQQLHGKAAESILTRLIERFPDQLFPTPKQLSRMRMESYRTCGFSEAKALAIIGIAKAQERGKIPSRAESALLTDEMLISTLMQLRGIGRWTVEMFLIFTLGRLDVMPVDDFGVRSALMQLFDLSDMPKKSEFATFTNTWSPYRSVGAWYLWRYADSQK
jgi:DNA-3-methyladenine glycosylase II